MKSVSAKLMSVIIASLLVLALIPVFTIGISAAGIDAKTGVNAVYLNGAAGNDSNDGTTAAKAVSTFEKAITLASAGNPAEAVIVVCGETPMGIANDNILPEHTTLITLTSYYNGTDYRTTGAKLLSPAVSGVALCYFNGPFVFQHITFKMMQTNFIYAMQYNNLTVGDDVVIEKYDGSTANTAYPILIAGCNGTGGEKDKAVGAPTISKNCTIVINSGDWQYYRGGDRDTQVVFDGTLDTTINGGVYHQESNATSYCTNSNNNSATGKGIYTSNAKITLTLNGGTFDTLIASVYTQPYTPANTSEATITVNINDGCTIRNYFCAAMANNGVFNGKIIINVNGGDLSTLQEAKLENLTVGGTGTITVNKNTSTSPAAYEILVAKSVASENVTFGTITPAAVTTAPVVTTAAPTGTTAAPSATTAAGSSTTPTTGNTDVVIIMLAAALAAVSAAIVISTRKRTER